MTTCKKIRIRLTCREFDFCKGKESSFTLFRIRMILWDPSDLACLVFGSQLLKVRQKIGKCVSSAPPKIKKEAQPVTKQLQLPWTCYITGQRQMGASSWSWMWGLYPPQLTRHRADGAAVCSGEAGEGPQRWGGRVGRSVSALQFLPSLGAINAIRARLEYLGFRGEPWCQAELSVWWFEGLGVSWEAKLPCCKWIESLGNRPWIPQKNVIQ